MSQNYVYFIFSSKQLKSAKLQKCLTKNNGSSTSVVRTETPVCGRGTLVSPGA